LRRWTALALTLMVLAAVVGCSSVRFNDTFNAKLYTAAHAGKSVDLHDLTDFDWDTVYFFQAAWKGSSVNEVVGEQVMPDGDYQDDNVMLWVFKHDGRVVRTFLTDAYVVIGVPNPVVPVTSVLLVPTADGSQLRFAGGSPAPSTSPGVSMAS
jgi:hypothetical protein